MSTVTWYCDVPPNSANLCPFCGTNAWEVSATIISCKRCGALWGLVNGKWELDPDSVRRSQASVVESGRCPSCVHAMNLPLDGASPECWPNWPRYRLPVADPPDSMECVECKCPLNKQGKCPACMSDSAYYLEAP